VLSAFARSVDEELGSISSEHGKTVFDTVAPEDAALHCEAAVDY
jgi:hypothetical protein